MNNCFTLVFEYLDKKYNLPKEWNGYTRKDMELFVKDQKKFLAKRQHIKFFKSFCTVVKRARKDDIILTKGSVGCAINQFAYWVRSDDTKGIIHKLIDKNECLILRINNE